MNLMKSLCFNKTIAIVVYTDNTITEMIILSADFLELQYLSATYFENFLF